MGMPNLKEYERRRSYENREATPAVTIQRRGLITFNSQAARTLGNPTAVTFLIDEEERLLGFRKVSRGGPGRPAPAVVRGPGAKISAVTVLRHLNVDLSAPRRYPLIMMDGTHCIDLKQPGTIVTNNRRRKLAGPARQEKPADDDRGERQRDHPEHLG